MYSFLGRCVRSVVDPVVQLSGICDSYVANGGLSEDQIDMLGKLGVAVALLALLLKRNMDLPFAASFGLIAFGLAAKSIARIPEICEAYVGKVVEGNLNMFTR